MMNINIDSAIFIGFLIINLTVGLFYSRGIKNIRQYAIGGRNFSTATIAATLVATWVGGDWFFNSLHETYANGLYFVWASIVGNVLCFLSIGIFFAPRLAEFLGSISIAEAMGDLYGKHVRVVTAIAGFIGASGIIAVQLKVSGLLFEYCFAIPGIYGVLIGGAIVTIYSTLGGIRSVTFTDTIQFFTFGTIIPTIVFFVLGTLDSVDVFIDTLRTHELFDYRQVFDFSQPKSVYYLFLFLYTFLPAFNPAIFQRIAMSKDTKQIRQSFIAAAFIAMLIGTMLAWIGALVLSTKPHLDTNEIVRHILFDYSYTGLKGLTLAGIMAMVMSTADSYVNSTAVLVVHDFCKPLKINIIKDELIFCRFASLTIGIFAIALSLKSGSLLQLLLTLLSFYMPIVTVPFIMTVLGFRSSGKSVLIGMGAGFTGVLIWEMFFKVANIEGLIPGMIANLVFLVGSHYFLKQPGGWVGIKDCSSLQQIRHERKTKTQYFINLIKNFNLFAFFRSNSPNGEAMYVYFGLFCMISTFVAMHTLPKDAQLQYPNIVGFIYPSVLFMSTILASYPLWPSSWKAINIVPVFWNLSIFYILVCVNFLLVIISDFAHLQLMAFMVNLIIIAVMVRWQWALLMIIVGVLATIKFLKFYVGIDYLGENTLSTQFEAAYLLLLVSSTLIIFLKPKQEYIEATEEKNEHLNGRLNVQDKELEDALSLKAEFLRNIPHEYHAAMTGVIGPAEILSNAYDKLSEEHKKIAIDTIYKSSLSLKSFDDNITTLARLSKPNYELSKEDINFSALAYERVQACRKYYEENTEDHEFVLELEDNIIINVDKSYMIHLLDNLIMNAIKYCKKGKISIALNKSNEKVNFIISDEGIGIPKAELHEIFKPFAVSSKTRTSAGGRGVGLATCRRIVEVHGGDITAESNGEKGSTFRVEFSL